MIELCYLYVYNYKCLKDVELVFDTEYEYHYTRSEIEDKKDKLEIKKNKQLQDEFWGPRISTLTAIVGNNGAGKTTALRVLMEEVVEEFKKNSVLAIYKDSGDLYYNVEDREIEWIDIIPKKSDKKPIIPTFYYSNAHCHFEADNVLTGEFSGLVNASNMFMFIKDLQDYANEEWSFFMGYPRLKDYKIKLGHPLFFHLNAHFAQDQYRIAAVLANKELRDVLNKINFEIPPYIRFYPNSSGQKLNNLSQSDKQLSEELLKEDYYTQKKWEEMPVEQGKKETQCRFIHFNLINMAVDPYFDNNKEKIIELLGEWKSIVKSAEPDVDIYDEFFALAKERCLHYEYNKQSEQYERLVKVLKKIDEHCVFKDGYYYIKIVDDEGRENFENFLKFYKSNGVEYLVSRVFDLNYVKDLSGYTTLSGGEAEILRLISRLYYFIVTGPNKFENKTSQLVVLDEAETMLHPEWQRNYINIITAVLNCIGDMTGINFNVVLTTHSPLILSDIPNQCVNYLKRENGVTRNVRKPNLVSFGANIFDIYRNSFFLENGFVGEFARTKILKVKDFLTGQSNDMKLKDAEHIINMIGEPILKSSLRKLYESKVPNEDLIEYYRNKIKELEGNKNETNNN